jgi:hypothetical protein
MAVSVENTLRIDREAHKVMLALAYGSEFLCLKFEGVEPVVRG